MNELSLFSGAGGGLLGTKLLGFNHIGYVEHDEYCQRIIGQRIKDGLLDNAPIFNDVKSFIDIAHEYRGFTDVVTAGFPCQSHSLAGKRLAGEDDRNLWPETIEIIKRVRPKFCLLENVAGLLSSGGGNVEDETGRPVCGYFGDILRDISESGYDARWSLLGADDVGAMHRRKRLWIRLTDTRC